ncbi:hypothetical protein P9112_005422 [Eukaryota sp. TZLM1-RC]
MPHLLPCDFTFYFSKRTNQSDNYGELLKQLTTVDTVEMFHEVYQYLKRPSDFTMESNLFLFRCAKDRPIKPEWEDEYNSAGGRLIFRVGKNYGDYLWETLLFETVSGNIFAYAPNVTGIAISCRTHEIVLSIWCATSEDTYIDALKTNLRQVLSLPEETSFRYQKHNVSKRF